MIFQGTPLLTSTLQLHTHFWEVPSKSESPLWKSLTWNILKCGKTLEEKYRWILSFSPANCDFLPFFSPFSSVCGCPGFSHECKFHISYLFREGSILVRLWQQEVRGQPCASPFVGLYPVPPLLHSPKQILLIPSGLSHGHFQRSLDSNFPLTLRNVRSCLNSRALHWHLFTLFCVKRGNM